jgi:hypothetical protein
VSTPRRLANVGDDDAAASGNDHFRGRGAEARRAATHKDGTPVQLHRAILSRPVQQKGRRSFDRRPELEDEPSSENSEA